MIKKLFFGILFFNVVFMNAQQLEENIYNALDYFTANKNLETLKLITRQEQEFETKVNSKEEKLALTILQCNKAYYLKEINQPQKAILTYEKAWKRFEESELKRYDIIEFCLKPLGNLYTKAKDYTNAENIIKYYIFLSEKEQNETQKIAGIINLSKVYQCIQKHNLVVKMIDETLNIHKFTINTVQNKKLSTIKMNSLLALKTVQKQEFVLEDNESATYLAYQKNIQEGNFIEALENFQKVKNNDLKTITNSRDIAKLHIEEAQLFLLLKDEEKAKENINISLSYLIANYTKNKQLRSEQLFAESLLITVFDMKAVLEKNIDDALKNYDNSFYVSDLLEEKITTQETKIILQSEKRIRSEKCISLLIEKYENTLEQGVLEKAFLYADKGKSYTLKDKLLKKELLKKHPKDSLLLLEKQLLKEQQIVTNKLLKATSSIEISELNKELNALSVQLKNIQVNIRKKFNKDSLIKTTLKKVQQKVTKQEAVFIEYFFGKKAIYQFVIQKNNIKVNTISLTKETTQQIINYIRLFNSPTEINNDIKSFTSQAHKLYTMLFFNETNSFENVIMVTDGLLNFIPFETLLTKKTNEMSYANMPFVVKKHSITYNFNADFLMRRNVESKQNKILGFFPVFSNTSKELKYSLNEAKVVEDKFESILFKNEKATKQNFIKNINKANIIHLSTHSESGNYIGAANIEFYNETLSVNELYTLDCNVDLVVLSACETGVGSLIKGEGAISIARGFNYIGAENLLFSLWEINDKSTSKLMNEFYNSYNTFHSFSYANQQAKNNYLKNSQIENYNKSPYYWGAFVYYGALSDPIKSNKIVILIIGGVLLFLVFLHFIRKKNYS